MPFFEARFGSSSLTIRGFTISFLLLAGAVPAFFAGQLADCYNHLHVTMIGALSLSLALFYVAQLFISLTLAKSCNCKHQFQILAFERVCVGPKHPSHQYQSYRLSLAT